MQKSPIFSMSVIALAAVSAGRFIGMMTGQHCGAGAKAQGVAVTDAAIGEAFSVDVLGTSIVTSGAAVAAGVEVKSDANGKVIARAGAGELLGWSVTAASAADQKIEVLLAL